jgi:hypothetical protein
MTVIVVKLPPPDGNKYNYGKNGKDDDCDKKNGKIGGSDFDNNKKGKSVYGLENN